MKNQNDTLLINDGQSFTGALTKFGSPIPIYDDGFGRLWIARSSIHTYGIIRARTFEDAYRIAEDEFFDEASETTSELIEEYGFRREHKKVIKSAVTIPAKDRDSHLGPFEKFAELSDYSDNGKLPEGVFLRWETIETPDKNAWADNELFQEAYGFRPNGCNVKDKLGHGIYAKDLNGDMLDELTPELLERLEVQLSISNEE